MKKIIIALTVLLLTQATHACGIIEDDVVEEYVPPVEPEIDYEGLQEEVKNELDLIELNSVVYESFDLVEEVEGYDISWRSSNEDSLKIDHYQAIVTQYIADVDIVLEASVLIDDDYVMKTYYLTVGQLEVPEIDNNTNPIEVSNYLNEKLKFDNLYRLKSNVTASGKISGSFLSYNISQNVSTDKFKYDSNSLFYSVTSETTDGPGKLNFYHEALYIDGKFSYYTTTDKTELEENESPKLFTRANYSNTYGKLPTDDEVTGFVISDETVSSAIYNGEEDGVHEFIYEIDINNSNLSSMELRYLKYGSGEEVSLKTVKITIYIDGNWNLLSYDLDETYYINLGSLGNTKYDGTLTQKSTTSLTKITEHEMMFYYPQITKYKDHLASL